MTLTTAQFCFILGGIGCAIIVTIVISASMLSSKINRLQRKNDKDYFNYLRDWKPDSEE